MPPDFAIISESKKDNFIVVSVDTNKATFQGRPWRSLGDFGRRKFENLLVLGRPKDRLHIKYVSPAQ